MSKDIRWNQRFQNYKKALNRLREAVFLAKERELSDLEQQGLIQSFEFTHELAWKTLQDFFKERGNDKIYGSKDATRIAFSYNLLENGDIWMNMIKSRNKSSHTYNEKTAQEIVDTILRDYYNEFENLKNKLSSLQMDS